MQIKAFDRYNLVDVRRVVDAALAKAGEELGIRLSIGRITFSEGEFRTKLVGNTAVGTVGDINTFGRSVLMLASLLGDKYQPGKKFVHPHLGVVSFVDYLPRSRKFPFLIQTASGKKYKIPHRVADILLDAPAK